MVQAQRQPYEGQHFPEPGEDPELVEIILELLGDWFAEQPPAEAMQALTARIQAHVTKENKRKNLVGEGFEDTLAALLHRSRGIRDAYEIRTRPWLHGLPGFHPAPPGQKPRQVDLALIHRSTRQRVLMTAKWSVRSDREEQFVTDFRDYARYEALGQDFDYVLITNEFDAARLAAACDARRENAYLFTDVVHVNPQGPSVAYGKTGRRAAAKMADRINDGRLMSLETWLVKLTPA
ncbi:MAG: hypothetical protein L0Y54_00665 [Sporichthyaceae bacterium]|nr:hypothetical protein [Sporichthyaceae bacterium]